MQILIIGGGFGGLTLANGLLKHATNTNTANMQVQVQIQVFERHTSPSQDLAGYGIHIGADGKRALQHCLPAAAYTRFLAAMTPAGSQWAFRDTQLRMLALRDDAVLSGKAKDEVERRAGHRAEFRDILLSGLPGRGAAAGGGDPSVVVHWGKGLSHYETLDGNGRRRVRAHFEDGSTAEGDVLIGADGAKSKVRDQRLPTLHREHLGIVVICGRYQLDEKRVNALPAMMTDGSLNNIVPTSKGWLFIASFPSTTGETGPGELENYTLWAYVIPKSQTPANAKGLSPQELRDIALSGVKDWADPLVTVVREADLSTVTPIVLQSMPHLYTWDASNVTLLGDAVHNMTPMAGVGANIALRDAHVLTDLLVSAARGEISVPVAVARYEEEMRGYANPAVALSRQIAEGSSTDSLWGRWVFNQVVRLAGISGFVMRRTIGRGGVDA